MGEKLRVVYLFVVLAAIVAGILYWFKSRPAKPVETEPVPVVTTHEPTASGRPLLLEIGSSAGPADLMMAAVLTTLRAGFAGAIEIEFLNADRDKTLKEKYGITVLPTQIYYSPEGKELARHKGFASEEDILKKWKDLGYDLLAPRPILPEGDDERTTDPPVRRHVPPL